MIGGFDSGVILVKAAMQDAFEVLVRSYGDDPVDVSSLKGSILRGKKGSSTEVTFASKGRGTYSAPLSDLDIGLGTYQCVPLAATFQRNPQCPKVCMKTQVWREACSPVGVSR